MRHLKFSDYDTRPWKNGKGDTQDIFLAPEGSDHSQFELRFSTAPIVEDGPFSSFPNADRCITLIEGNGLTLDFGDSKHELLPLQPFRFNSELSPTGYPHDGPVRVVNVMGNFDAWRIVEVNVVEKVEAEIEDEQFAFFFAIDGNWKVEADNKQNNLSARETVLMDHAGKLTAFSSNGSKGIFAILERI